MRWWLLVGLLWAAPSWASDQEAESAALMAQAIIEGPCGHVESNNRTLADAARQSAQQALDAVEGARASSRKVYLLYWSGVLAQCLGQLDEAQARLEAFVSLRAESALWTSLVEDATRRLRILMAADPDADKPNPWRIVGAVGGGALGLTAVGTGLGAGSAWTDSQEISAQLYAEPHRPAALGSLLAEGEALSGQHRGLVVATAALGATSAALLAVALASSDRPAFALLPTSDGVVLALGGRW